MVGIDARIRESSVTLPSSRGTLKSTRTKTRLPDGSKSRTVSLSMSRSPLGAGAAGAVAERKRGGGSGGCALPDGQARRDICDQIGHAAAVTPLVVVPTDDFDHGSAE